jgi:hypothetical protein
MKKGVPELQDSDRAMKEIENLYAHMFTVCQGPKGAYWNIHPQIKSRLHKRILEEIEYLREIQRGMRFGYQDYWEIDRKIRRRLLKEIQIIIDAYVIAKEENRLGEWEVMYGDIEHYKRDFFYFRMDPDYESLKKSLDDYKLIEDR